MLASARLAMLEEIAGEIESCSFTNHCKAAAGNRFRPWWRQWAMCSKCKSLAVAEDNYRRAITKPHEAAHSVGDN